MRALLLCVNSLVPVARIVSFDCVSSNRRVGTEMDFGFFA